MFKSQLLIQDRWLEFKPVVIIEIQIIWIWCQGDCYRSEINVNHFEGF